LVYHTEKCQKEQQKRKQMEEADPDLLLAMKLQQEEEQKQNTEVVPCGICKKKISIDNIYILDECSHKFCKDCITNYVSDSISTSVTVICPLKECKKELSVRDTKELLPAKLQKISQSSRGKPSTSIKQTGGTGKGAERIMSEFKHILASNPEKNGYSVEPVDDNMYLWEIKLFDFDPKDPIAQDMKKMKIKHIILNVVFPQNYPFSPPYVRVIRPRFQYLTGHVTIGGSVCMEILTNKSWTPANSIEAIIVSLRAELVEGGARLDPNNKRDYSEAEAKEAFDRMVQKYGWY